MDTVDVVLGIILLAAAVFLVIVVLLQPGKSNHLSGTIAGGADTFFGKTKGKTIDRMLSKITAVVAVIFALLVITVYVPQMRQERKAEVQKRRQRQTRIMTHPLRIRRKTLNNKVTI